MWREGAMTQDPTAGAFRDFAAVIKRLRTPGTGCPWDLEQTHQTLKPYLVEETHEVLAAIDGGDDHAFCEELGDLLLQVVLHAQVAEDRGAFSIADVVHAITEKMIRRRPHVFGSAQVKDAADVVNLWEQIKAAEKEAKAKK
jgi:MazG family protein